MRTWQARLAQKQDRIRRKLIDLNISLEGSPTDCIRIRLKKNDEGDIVSRVIEKADVIHVIFPPMKDVPYRRLGKDIDGKIQLTSLVGSAEDDQKQNYEIIAPHDVYLRPDDLLIRVMIDPDTPDQPSIFTLQVLESLGTFGGSMIIQSKYKTNLYNETLSDNVLNIIAEMAKRRLFLNY